MCVSEEPEGQTSTQQQPSTVKAQVEVTAPKEVFPQSSSQPKVVCNLTPVTVKDTTPDPWQLKITVVCDAKNLPAEAVSWSLEAVEGGPDALSQQVTLTALEQVVKTHTGNGLRKFRANASLAHWDLVENQSKIEASVGDGGKDEIKLVLKPRSWIKF